MKTSRQLLCLLLGVNVCLAPAAIAGPNNDKPPKRPMQEYRRGDSDGPRDQRGKGPRHHRSYGREGHLMKRIHNAADKNNDGILDNEERKEFDRLVSEAKQRMHKEILARFDEDGDGKLSEEERVKARAAGRKKMKTLRQEAIARFDKDGDGKLNAQERQDARQAVRQRMMDRAKKFDTNGDGILDDDERAAAREAIGKQHKSNKPNPRRRFAPRRDQDSSPLQGGEANRKELRQRFDTNKDGKLNESERETMRETIRKLRAKNAE